MVDRKLSKANKAVWARRKRIDACKDEVVSRAKVVAVDPDDAQNIQDLRWALYELDEAEREE